MSMSPGPRRWRRAFLVMWWPWPSRVSPDEMTCLGWATSGIRPCSWASFSCGRQTGPTRWPNSPAWPWVGAPRCEADMLIKICGITSEPDAMLAAALGADAVGFIFAPSPRQVSPQAVRSIIERMPPEILSVGVFRNESRVRVVDIVNSIGLRAAQLHGDETIEDTQWIAERVPLVIKAFPAGHRN